jgi:isochorismate synthase
MLTSDLAVAPSFLRQSELRARQLGRPVLLSITQPTVARDPLTMFERGASGERGVWLTPDGDSMVALGAAIVMTADGPDRFATIRRAWAGLVADACVDQPEHLGWNGPLALGGFSFDPLRPSTGLWSGFSDGRLVVPERLYVERGGRAWLTRNCLVGGSTSPRSWSADTAAAEIELVPSDWRAIVASVAQGIRDRTLGIEKVVLARSHGLRQSQPFDTTTVLRRLASSYPSCTIFGIEHDGGAFVGATPERLVALQAGVASTGALAGSTGRGATPAQDRSFGQALLNDPKERAEHDYVVRALRDGLEGISTRIVADAEPRLKQLPNVQHLWTPMRADVLAGTTILELVERLHPTPAVGGFPTRPALELIRAREHLDRGWYAAPIGWLDGAGNGEFVVGLRSALLRENVATLFAGCGIVADSDAAAEAAELGWKLRPMLAALGQGPN